MPISRGADSLPALKLADSHHVSIWAAGMHACRQAGREMYLDGVSFYPENITAVGCAAACELAVQLAGVSVLC